MSEELKCPFLIQEDWCNDFDGPCAVVKGNRCEVHQQLAKRDARIAELEDTVRKLTGRERILGDETILYAAHKETIAYKDKQIAELEAERDRLRKALERVVKLLDRPMLKDDMCLYMDKAIRVARKAQEEQEEYERQAEECAARMLRDGYDPSEVF